jgi:hypothetical protein
MKCRMTNQGENKKLKRKKVNIEIKTLEDKLRNHRIKYYEHFLRMRKGAPLGKTEIDREVLLLDDQF